MFFSFLHIQNFLPCRIQKFWIIYQRFAICDELINITLFILRYSSVFQGFLYIINGFIYKMSYSFINDVIWSKCICMVRIVLTRPYNTYNLCNPVNIRPFLTSIQRFLNVMDVGWTSKQRCVLTWKIFKIYREQSSTSITPKKRHGSVSLEEQAI